MNMKDKFLCVMAQYDKETELKLKEIQKLVSNGLGWTAHTTMLIDNHKNILKALPYVAKNFNSFIGKIESISLYEFWPTRFILEENLQ